MTTVTANEYSVLRAILTNDFADGHAAPGKEVWFDCLDNCKEALTLSGHALAGVCGTLTQKGLVNSYGRGRDGVISLTDAGYLLASTDAERESHRQDLLASSFAAEQARLSWNA